MASRTDLVTDPETLDWLLQARRGTAYFARKLNELTDAELTEPSMLAGWSRKHVIAHVGYNARALARLVDWAATGIENPMYASATARNAEIALGATLSPLALRNLFDHAAIHLNVEWRDLPADFWHNEVRTAQGRTVPVAETVWLRTREIWIHAVDLDNGARFADIPEPVLTRLHREIQTAWTAKGVTFELPDGALPDQVQWMTGRGGFLSPAGPSPHWL